MATTLYFTDAASTVSSGGEETLIITVGVRGVGLATGAADTNTAGKRLTRDTVSDVYMNWHTPALDAVTISGTVTINLWMSESNMSANVDARIDIFREDNAGVYISTILSTAKGTELPVTTRAAQNWTATPTSTTLAAGDRLRMQIWGGDTLAQASTYTFNASWGATSAAADGDSYVTFTETITEQVAAASVPYFRPYTQLLAH